MRDSNTNSKGGAWTQAEIYAVRKKAQIINGGYDPSRTRKDICNALIDYDKHGKQVSRGWEIDHIKPISKGGSDDIQNLQPLQWENNRKKTEDYPVDSFCVVSRSLM